LDIAMNVVTADPAHRAMRGLDHDATVTADRIFKPIHPGCWDAQKVTQ
jgi:hypothetical protein